MSTSPFDEDPSAEMAQSNTARHWLVTVLGRGGAHTGQLLALLILARLLVPADFGLLTMVMSVIGVASIFSDLGLSAATIRQPKITHEQVSTLFWINLGFGALMTGLASAAAPWLARFYADLRAVPVTLALAWTFFLGGIGAQHTALLRRRLKFTALAWINVLSMGAGQASAIILALAGYGYWALVSAMLIGTLMNSALAWLWCNWRPGLPHWDAQIRSMISFGGYLVVFTLLGFAAQNVPNVLNGRLWGAAAVGYYSRAFVLLTLLLNYIVDPLNLIAPAALSRLLDDAVAYRNYYLKTVAMMLFLTAPIGFASFVLADDIIRFVLGPQWNESAGVLRILALAVVPQTLCATSGWLYMSHGDSRTMMKWGVGGWGMLIACLVAGAPFGIRGMALAYTLGMLVLLYPCMKMAFKRTTLKFSDLFRVVWPGVLAAALAALATWTLANALRDVVLALRLSACLALYALVYFVLLTVVFRQGTVFVEMWQQLRYRRSA
ncbi:MAG: lipopolysaccharide biosynthesis protein [Stenotrophobium sp.]